MTGKKHDVFISYSWDDRIAVEELVHKLKARGIDVWEDKKTRTGAHWPDRVRKAIKDSDTVLVIVSPHFLESPAAQFETGVALGLTEDSPKTRIVPVLVGNVEEKSLPPLLRHKQALQVRRLDADKLSEKIEEFLNVSAT
jgi:hypothetical protein